MNAEKWTNIFERERADRGVQEATKVLIRGLRRELRAKLERDRPDTEVGVGYCFVEIEEIWKHVAEETGVLKAEGFRILHADGFRDALSAYDNQVPDDA